MNDMLYFGDNFRDKEADSSAFGEMATANFEPLTGWAFTYNINPGVVKTELENDGTVTNDLGHAVLNTGADPDGHAHIITVRSSRYVPGIGGKAIFTTVFGTPQENSQQIVGLINHDDGWGFGYNGLDFGILRKSNSVENWIPQTSWNVNKMPDLIPQKGNVYQIKYQWLGYGMQYFYIENRLGELELVHQIEYSNTETETSILNPNLPLSACVKNTGNTIPIILKTPSAIAGLEGDALNDAISINLAMDSIKTVTAGTNIPLLAFRMGDTYKAKTNRLFAQILRGIFATDTNKSIIIRVFSAGTVTGGDWLYLSEDLSPLEYNKTFTAYTPGLLIASFPLSKVDSYQVPIDTSFFRMYADQQVVLVADTTGIGDITASMNWKSFV